PSASPPWTCCRTGASSSAPVSPPRRPSWAASASTRRPSGPCGKRARASPSAASPRRRSPATQATSSSGRHATALHSLALRPARYYVIGHHRPGVTDVWAAYQQDRAQAGYDPAALGATDSLTAKSGDGSGALRGAVGTPDQIRDYLRRYEDYGVDQVILASQTGKNRHEHVMESLELFGREVLPEFLERDEAASREKAKRMEPVIEAALARKPA